MAEKQQDSALPAAPQIKRKHEGKYRKKDPKSWENVSKSLIGMSEAEKLQAVEMKYNELYNDFRKLSLNLQTLEKQNAILQKEKDHTQTEYTKGVMVTARLESLCRELQKQNKQIKDDCMTTIKQEEERREGVSLKFASKMAEIKTVMDQTRHTNETLRVENNVMNERLIRLLKEFQSRNDDIERMSKDMDLERQYFQARLEKMELEMSLERQNNIKENANMQIELDKSEGSCQLLMNTIKQLQTNLTVYKKQYEELESKLTKNDEVFDTFRTEIEAMAQQMKLMDQQTQMWKTKYQETCAQLSVINKAKQSQKSFIGVNERKLEQLQKLCRQLQVDRAAFMKLLKDNGIEPVTQICNEPEKVRPYKKLEVVSSKKQLTKKEQELDMLKNNLKVLQSKLCECAHWEQEMLEEKKKLELSKDTQDLPVHGPTNCVGPLHVCYANDGGNTPMKTDIIKYDRLTRLLEDEFTPKLN